MTVEGPSFAPMIAALVFVLALIPVAMWLLKKLGAGQAGGGAGMRVVGSLGLGQRERLVLVDDGEQLLLLGVTAASITRVGTLPRDPARLAPTPAPAAGFASMLAKARNRGTPPA